MCVCCITYGEYEHTGEARPVLDILGLRALGQVLCVSRSCWPIGGLALSGICPARPGLGLREDPPVWEDGEPRGHSGAPRGGFKCYPRALRHLPALVCREEEVKVLCTLPKMHGSTCHLGRPFVQQWHKADVPSIVAVMTFTNKP